MSSHSGSTVVRKSSLAFRQLLDTLPAAAYICDATGLITYFNRHARTLWGRDPRLNHPDDRFCGSFKLFSPDGSVMTHDRCWMALALLEGREYDGYEVIIERPDGKRHTVLAHASPFHDDAGRIFGAVNILVDISERKAMEDALREADRKKTDFLAMLAHELRNPLAPLRNALQVMRAAGCGSEMAVQAHAIMERQIGHMVRLIDDLLDVSRITKGKIELRKERVDLVEIIRDALDTSTPLVDASGHTLTVALPPKPVLVHADRTRLAQVFANLLNNSAKYTERGGHIHLALERHGTDAVVTLRDDGMGISPDMLPNIFDMFVQADQSLERSRSGLGIGLSLVRGLVEMHGGTVEARSEGVGKGSEFTVRLSVAAPLPDAPTRADNTSCHVAPAVSKYRILVVDDNRDSAISVAMMLKIAGHEARTAYDGLEAIAVAEAFRPDVMLLDIGLPKLNGYDACRQLRERPWGKRMILIALTGWGHEDDKRRSKEAGFNFHMVKPVDPEALEKLLAGLLVVPD